MNGIETYVLMKRLAVADAPAGAGTVTIFDTTAMTRPLDRGLDYKLIVFGVFANQASAANGYTVDESWDKGLNWDNAQQQSVLASTYTRIFFKVAAPDFRVRYTGGGVTPTTFRGGLIADFRERSNG